MLLLVTLQCHMGELASFGNLYPPPTLGKGAAMADPEGEILTLEEVASYLKAGKRTVYRLAQDGKIPAFKLGGSWRFRRAELDRWIAASIENPQKQGER